MKRSQAIHRVVSELKVIKEELIGGKSINPLRFLTLSEIFKFGIEPKSNRFTAICLDEASKTDDSKKHLDVVDEVLDDEEGEVVDNDTEEEVNELLDYDGSLQSSKVPMGGKNVKTLSSKKTTDDVVKATSQAGTWTGAGHYFKRYYGESVEELGENDMSEVLGYEETKDKNAEETIEYFEKEHEMDTDEAKDRTESMGKTQKLDKKGENYQRLTEKENLKKIAEDKARKMIEVILNNKSDDGEITHKSFLNNKIKNLIKLAKAEGVSIDDLIEKINYDKVNQDLKNDTYSIPDELINKLQSNLQNLNKDDKGYERCNNLVNDGTVTYSQAKKLKHELENDLEGIESETVGGEDMLNFINSSLNTRRNSVHSSKKIRQNSGEENVFKKSHTKDKTKNPTKVRKIKVSTKSDDINNNRAVYEEIDRIKQLIK